MAVVSTVTFNGRSLNPKRFRIQHLPDYTIAERDFDREHITGRDGDLIIDNKSYKNVPRKYSISFGADGPEDFAVAVSEISKWLDCPGYCELEDTYDPEYFYRAVPEGSPKVYSLLNGYMGKVDIEFSCIPRKFLKYGRVPVSRNIVDAAGDPTIFRMYNPSEYDALPMIYVYPKTSSETISNPKCKILFAENINSINGSDIEDSIYYGLKIDLTGRILPSDILGINNVLARYLAVVVDCEMEDAYNAFDHETKYGIMGDVDGDGVITMADATRALQASIGTADPPLTYAERMRTDMDHNGVISTGDAQTIAHMVEVGAGSIYGRNQNSIVTVLGSGFPVLKAKKNNIIWFEGDVSSIAVVPRYWTR